MREGWHALEPTTPLEWNWHIPAICVHIQSCLEDWMARQSDPSYPQRFQNLLINVPPGTAKSRIVSVYAPAWMWLRWPTWKAIFLSANPRVALRDSGYSRDLIESDWYRGWFEPPWTLAADQNAKGLYKNTAGGFRQSLGWFGKLTGDRADALFVDDPHDASEANSEVIRRAVLDRWDSTIFNRVNDVRCSIRVGVMQRLHQEDWSGHILESGTWEHLCIPQEFDPEMSRTTAIGWKDPRTESGELLFPTRFTREFLEGEKHPTRLGAYGYAGQHLQRPTPREGGMFKPGRLEIVAALPAECRKVRYWDKAGTSGGGAYSAGVLMAKSADGRYYVADVIRGQWSAGEREKVIKQTAEIDGKGVDIWAEQEPGSGGKESAENTVIMLAGWTARAESVSGDKESRARPFAAQVEAGNVSMLAAPWNKAFVEELGLFPFGKYKDQCLVAGTMISTSLGDVPIEAVRPGMMVLTRKGYRRVLEAGMTSRSAPVVRVDLEGGRHLIGTGNHPVFSQESGFIDLDTCSDAIKIMACENIIVRQPLTSLYTRGSSSLVTRSHATATIGSITNPRTISSRRASTTCIARSGRTFTVQSRKVTSSTTRMTTPSTTRPTTWNASARKSTSESTPRWDHSHRITSGIISKRSGRWLPSGIAPKRAAHGTGSMAGRPSRIGRVTTGFARVAAGFSARYIPKLGRAPRSASRRFDPLVRRMGRWPSAPSAGRTSRSRVALVPLSVVRVHAEYGVATVFNLAVEGVHEYFANGLLVHNCDAASGGFNKLALIQVRKSRMF